MIHSSIQSICILGTGLIGGSVGLGLRRAQFSGRITGCARRQTTLDRAMAVGCIDEGFTDLARACRDADLVVIAAPIPATLTMLDRIAELPGAQPLITDASSTKQSIVRHAERVLREPARFLGAHPMAGRAETGPDAAQGDLFERKVAILTPTERTHPQTVERIGDFWRALGMRIVTLDPEQHDLAVARISHLPHALAALLVQIAQTDQAMDVASSGFADTTRIASGDPELWADIFLDNGAALGIVIGQLRRQLDHLSSLVDAESRDQLIELLKQAKDSRDRWKDPCSRGQTE